MELPSQYLEEMEGLQLDGFSAENKIAFEYQICESVCISVSCSHDVDSLRFHIGHLSGCHLVYICRYKYQIPRGIYELRRRIVKYLCKILPILHLFHSLLLLKRILPHP